MNGPVEPLTVRSLIDLPEVRKWHPEVLTGLIGQSSAVRWLHVGEVLDIAVMLKGGEILLTTGALWPLDDAALTAYIDSLAEAGVAGVFLALGRAHRSAPTAVVRACRRRGLALVAFHRPVPFVEVTELVHARILHEGYAQLALADEVRASFSKLMLGGAAMDELLTETARMAQCPVVLENLNHRVLAAAGGDLAPADLLRDWDRQSRSLPVAARVTSLPQGWVVTPVAGRAQTWGRLVLAGSPLNPQSAEIIAGQAAQAIALLRMLSEAPGDPSASWEQAAVGALLTEILHGHAGAQEDLRLRARAAGFVVVHRIFTPVVARVSPATAGTRAMRLLSEAVTAGALTHEVPALVTPLSTDTVVAVLSSPDAEQSRRDLELVVAATRERLGAGSSTTVFGVGPECSRLEDVPAAYREAVHVADAALAGPDQGTFARLADVHLQGLVRLLRDDTRLQAFVERELGGLLRPRARNDELLAVLRTFLFTQHNKSATAQAHHLSRPALYRRLVEIESRLGLSLDDPDRMVSLHVALLARDAQQGGGLLAPAQASRVTSTETNRLEAAEPE